MGGKPQAAALAEERYRAASKKLEKAMEDLGKAQEFSDLTNQRQRVVDKFYVSLTALEFASPELMRKLREPTVSLSDEVVVEIKGVKRKRTVESRIKRLRVNPTEKKNQ